MLLCAKRTNRSKGVTLIELMVALGIGAFLMIGAFTVFVNSRTTFRTNESVARLQENARYVLDVIEPDIRMAGFWGLGNRAGVVAARATPDDPLSPLSPAGDCGINWTVNLDRPVDGSNNNYDFDCAPYGSAVENADTLVVRRAAVDSVSELVANTIYIQTSRNGMSGLFAGTAVPRDLPSVGAETHELVVNGYYVSRSSTLDTPGNRVPSLRRKFLRGGGSQATIVDEEVLPGVEDMQIQFGVDTDTIDSMRDGTIDRYVDPDDPILDDGNQAYDSDARILAVRIWLRLRGETPEIGAPAGEFAYADRRFETIDDGYRRALLSKTIYLRNALGAF